MSKINKKLRQNQFEENLIYKKYKLQAMDVFRWENLPNGIESRYIEDILYNQGQGFFYNHPVIGFTFLPCFDSNIMNIYGDYVCGRVMSYNGLVNDEVVFKDYVDVTGQVFKANGVRMLNNDIAAPTKMYIIDYSKRMFDVEQSIRMNVVQQKYPYIIKGDKNTALSWKIFMNKILTGEESIMIDDKVDIGKVEVLNTGTPYVVDKMQEYRYELERELLTFLGIDNCFEKDERLLKDEIASNNEQISSYLYTQLKQREIACKLINEMYGLNISVRIVKEIIEEEAIERKINIKTKIAEKLSSASEFVKHFFGINQKEETLNVDE